MVRENFFEPLSYCVRRILVAMERSRSVLPTRVRRTKWRGRYPWDWYTNVGFSTGYTPGERERRVDVYMGDFRKILQPKDPPANCLCR